MASKTQVALVVGASRGIGRQIAIDLARNGYAVVVASKSTSTSESDAAKFPPNPNSQLSTIQTVEREIREIYGGEALAIPVDTRDPDSVQRLVNQTIQRYGRLDAVVYNAGAIWWASVEDTPMKRFQLMQRVNVEGLYATIQAALPHLKLEKKGRIVVVSPPIYSRFFRGKTAYAMGKVAMSVLTKGLAMDFERQGLKDMAITSIWPAVAIESAATDQFTRKNPAEANDLRKPAIFSDAILEILKAPASAVNGQLLLDEDFLRDHAGIMDFAKYSVVPGMTPRRIMPVELPDLAVKEQDDEGKRYDSSKGVKAKI
ncbi:putative Hydroxysteroid dehydrogenase-like protein 2 [Diplogelasinospora grovesii]|uniref:Hydroxysteroid dehydrogenase-like protein 2 n=1 Tax=Diplogelasinospora grovesii TaxID=303347 RepID=A0AAN6NDH2_9PEZI|nr:putative Hydroxysteroid dehydrogenase-like protein 2 [Diplogelasinospora grovesii]